LALRQPESELVVITDDEMGSCVPVDDKPVGTCQPHIDSHLIINMLFGTPPRSVWGS